MTLLALLFAALPVLEAAACAVEGCGVICASDDAAAVEPSSPDQGNCTDQGCACAAGHCHVASVPTPSQEMLVPIALDRASPLVTEAVLSTPPPLLERPPRV